MPKLDFTAPELATLASGIETLIKSAQRSQNSGRTPQIKEVYKQEELVLKALASKLLAAATTDTHR